LGHRKGIWPVKTPVLVASRDSLLKQVEMGQLANLGWETEMEMEEVMVVVCKPLVT